MNTSVYPNQISIKRYLLYGMALLGLLGAVWFGLSRNSEALPNLPTFSLVSPKLTMPASKPVSVTVPALGINAQVEELDIKSDNTIAVPKKGQNIGWYIKGPTPGELGPAILVGHLDWYSGPAVFYNLDKISIGDQVKVKRADGSTATFEVKDKQSYSQENFPTEAVYGAIDHAGLRLITCTGDFSKIKKRYSHNLVVYADLVASE